MAGPYDPTERCSRRRQRGSAGDKAELVRGKEEHAVRDVDRLAEAQRMPAGHFGYVAVAAERVA